MRKLSLFSGIGGIDLAAHWAGMQTVAFCEREPFPQQVLRKHWPEIPVYDNVCTLTAERLKEDGIIGPGRTIDIISAGYPCQPFSNAGKRRGKEDDRHLWPEVKRLLEEIRPRWFLGENVAGHVTLGLDDVLSDLESIGYIGQAFIIPSAAVGAPHRRDRVFIVAYTTSERLEGEQRSELEGRRDGFTYSCKTLADSTGNRCESRGTKSEGQQRKSGVTGCSSSWEIEVMADTTSIRQPGPRESLQPCNQEENGEGKASKPVDMCFGTERTTQSSLGGVLDGLSDWMDGHRWPAALGEEQYEWEPARVASGVKNRVPQLKALGNAVNPQQIYPILAAIKHINDLI